MKWTLLLALVGLEIGALWLLVERPYVGGPLLGLMFVAHLLYSALTGKQSNDGIR